MTLITKWNADYTVLTGLLETVAEAAQVASWEIAEILSLDIRKSISTPYPPSSDEGKPPHLRSGALRDGVRVDWSNGRNLFSGRFASGYHAAVRISTMEDTGKEYALALEDPSYIYNRPFIAPAIARLSAVFQMEAHRRIQRGFTRKTTGQKWNGRTWQPS